MRRIGGCCRYVDDTRKKGDEKGGNKDDAEDKEQFNKGHKNPFLFNHHGLDQIESGPGQIPINRISIARGPYDEVDRP